MEIVNNNFINEIQNLIFLAQQKAIKAVDFQRVILYWQIGEKIFNEIQNKQNRAEYGKKLIRNLAKELEPKYGSGYSYRQLYLFLQFYKVFPIVNTLYSQLSWSHYKLLIRIEDTDKREFYIAESIKNLWSVRDLKRQIETQLFERLLMSNDKKSVLEVAKKQKLPDNPKEIIKDPMVLEFLGLDKNPNYYEKDLETAIIENLQQFLLELGNGFCFVARQKRLHIDGDDFFVDLVFYNRLLQCFVIFEIKTHKLTHQDLGQLQMYVNYFDRIEKENFENPTIGVLLCSDKNDLMVEYSLPKDNKTILASKYELYLPNKEILVKRLKQELGKNNEKI